MRENRRRADFVEDIFAGIVAAAYNYLSSLALLIRSPILGAYRLAVRRNLPSVDQLAPQTLIFVTIFAIYPFEKDWKLTSALQGFVMERSVSRMAIVVVVRAFIAVLVIDASIHLIARIVSWRDRWLRERLITVMAYAYAAMTVYFVIAFLVAIKLIEPKLKLGSAWAGLILLLTMVASPVPPTVAALRHLTVRRSILRGLMHLGLGVVIIASFLGALKLSDSMGRWITAQREHPKVHDQSCELSSQKLLTAVIVVENVTDQPFILASGRVEIAVTFPDRRVVAVPAHVTASSLGFDLPKYVIPRNVVAWFKVSSNAPVANMPAGSVSCSVPALSKDPEASPATVEQVK